MDHWDIHHCLKVLNDKPKWFFQKENIGDKLHCLNILWQDGGPHLIGWIIKLLKHHNSQVRQKTAETVLQHFGKLNTLNDYEASLKKVPINQGDLDSYRDNFNDDIYVQLLGVASFNGNGYVREKAVRELGEIKHGDGLKFILFRLADWVEEVRNAASEALNPFLSLAYIDYVMMQLPTIDWLLKVERVNLENIHGRIIQFIVSQDSSDEFYGKIKRLNNRTRFLLFKSYLDYKTPNRERVSKIISDRHFVVLLELLNHLGKFPPGIQKEIIEKCLHDKSAAVRHKALHTSKSFGHAFNDRVNDLLSDENVLIRGLSRQLLKDRGFDFAQLYRKRIHEKYLLSGSIFGLSETGNPDDLALFEQNIFSGNKQVVIASLVSINKFDINVAKKFALDLLTHKNSRVRNKAVEILSKNCTNEILEKARDIYTNSGFQTKLAILRIYRKMGGWNILADLLLALKDDNEHIREQAWRHLERWRLKATRLFTIPGKTEIERAKQVLQSLESDMRNLAPARIKILEEVRFYLE